MLLPSVLKFHFYLFVATTIISSAISVTCQNYTAQNELSDMPSPHYLLHKYKVYNEFCSERLSQAEVYGLRLSQNLLI